MPPKEVMLGLGTDSPQLLSDSPPSAHESTLSVSPPVLPSSGSSVTAPSFSSSESPVTAPGFSSFSGSGGSTNLSPSTPQTRSVLADILNLPQHTPTGRRKMKAVSGARVLTSIEARRILEEKERKKKEDLEEKERRKQEREQKKLQRQEEQRKKQEEKAAKLVERVKAVHKKKESRKRNSGECSSSATKKNADSCDSGLQRQEVSSNECAICFGLYDEDIDPETGDLANDWIQCTNENCSVWMHTECLEICDHDFVCSICGTLFC